MDAIIIQHAIVTLVALGAAGFIGHKTFRAVKPTGGGTPRCASCPSAQLHKGDAMSPAGTTEVHSLKLRR